MCKTKYSSDLSDLVGQRWGLLIINFEQVIKPFLV